MKFHTRSVHLLFFPADQVYGPCQLVDMFGYLPLVIDRWNQMLIVFGSVRSIEKKMFINLTFTGNVLMA